ncbi:MAG: apolipoprotein N-acyltransferase [Ignavibacteriales bacterium]|nr:apolipoprotein N-acyltransferase [Ignavibacteriales bacterium]
MKIFKRWQKIELTQQEKKVRSKHRWLGVLSGVLLGLAFPPIPIPATLLIFIGLIPYFFVIDKKEKLIDLNRFTYLTAFIFNLVTVYWVGGWGAETDPFLMIAGVLLLFINPAFFLIPSTLFYFAKQIFNRKTAFYLFPFFWVTYEYFYMITDASFPWLTLANGLPYFLTFIQIADIIGALGISLLVVYINLFLFLAIKEFNSRKGNSASPDSKISFTFNLISALLLFIIPLIYGIMKETNYRLSDKKIKVGLIQPNLNPWDKWKGGGIWNLANIYFDLSNQAMNNKAEVIFWPETAFPVYLLDGSHQNIVDSIYNFVNRHKVTLITGMPDFRIYWDKKSAPPDAKHNKLNDYYYTTYNGILSFSPVTAKIEHYGKMKLVPFSERVPFVDALPFLGDLIKWEVGLSGWNKGRDTILFKVLTQNNKLEKPDTVKINSLVCYESIYPTFVAQFVQKGAQLISVVTNDSWFGNSSGPYQHKEIAVLRAIENRRTVVRAANGGISTIIDPLGRTLIETKMYTKTFITGYAPLETKITFFTKNPFIVPVVSSMISLFVVGMFFLGKLKKTLNI